jgi:hypothetical protein
VSLNTYALYLSILIDADKQMHDSLVSWMIIQRLKVMVRVAIHGLFVSPLPTISVCDTVSLYCEQVVDGWGRKVTGRGCNANVAVWRPRMRNRECFPHISTVPVVPHSLVECEVLGDLCSPVRYNLSLEGGWSC